MNNKTLKYVLIGIGYALLLVVIFMIGRAIGNIGEKKDEGVADVTTTAGSDLASADGETLSENPAAADTSKPSAEENVSKPTGEQPESNSSNEPAGEPSDEPDSAPSTEPSVEQPSSEQASNNQTVYWASPDGAVDTGNLTATGSGYEGTPGTGTFNYGEALQKAIIFYEAQRSGDLPESGRVSWRADSALTDGSDNGVDLTGGLYDAGDNVKFNLPMAYTSSILGWSVIDEYDAYVESGQLTYILDTIRWVNDYLIKCHTEDEVFYYQVGDGGIDHSWWGACEVMQMERPSYKVTVDSPGSCVVAQAAASLAICAEVFESIDPDYSATCLKHAKSLYAFADKTRSDAGYTAANNFYSSNSGYMDEIMFAAIWLYKVTGDKSYLDAAEGMWNPKEPLYKWTLCWDDKTLGNALLLTYITGDSKYSEFVENNIDYWTVGVDGAKINYTPDGLAYLDQWGALRYATTEAFVAAKYSMWDGCPADKATRYMDFAKSQVDYCLGSTGFSYVVGFGDNYPQHIHHRTAQGSYCDNKSIPEQARHILYGALVGGPRSDGTYPDDINDYSTSEVGDDYNAGFVGILAIMYDMYKGQTLKDFGMVDAPTEPEVYMVYSVNVVGQDFIELRSFIYNETAYPARVTDHLSCKYFIDLTEVYEAGGSVDNIIVSLNYAEGGEIAGIQAVDEANHIYAVEISFEGALIYPGGQSQCRRECQFRIRCDMGVWDSTNDPSYVDLMDYSGSTPVSAAHMALYDSGTLIFGEEP
ncbi:MAG: glycoside hydrolase family 9 protein [Lachnospiraceae bacterium]|nr:glycoside hydrolase family 9 protein [Lachnospiraceae bacterium]